MAKILKNSPSNPQEQNYFNTLAPYVATTYSSGPNLIEDVTFSGSVNVGDICQVSASNGSIERAQANSISNTNVIGICVEKSSSTQGSLQVAGITEEIYSSLNPGSLYFLSASNPGELTTSAPSSSSNVVVQIGIATSAKRMLLIPSIKIVRV